MKPWTETSTEIIGTLIAVPDNDKAPETAYAVMEAMYLINVCRGMPTGSPDNNIYCHYQVEPATTDDVNLARCFSSFGDFILVNNWCLERFEIRKRLFVVTQKK